MKRNFYARATPFNKAKSIPSGSLEWAGWIDLLVDGGWRGWFAGPSIQHQSINEINWIDWLNWNASAIEEIDGLVAPFIGGLWAGWPANGSAKGREQQQATHQWIQWRKKEEERAPFDSADSNTNESLLSFVCGGGERNQTSGAPSCSAARQAKPTPIQFQLLWRNWMELARRELVRLARQPIKQTNQFHWLLPCSAALIHYIHDSRWRPLRGLLPSFFILFCLGPSTQAKRRRKASSPFIKQIKEKQTFDLMK